MPIIVENIKGLYFTESLIAIKRSPGLYHLQTQLDAVFQIKRHPISDALLRPMADASRKQVQRLCDEQRLTHLAATEVSNSQKKLMQALWKSLSIKTLDEWYKEAKVLFQAEQKQRDQQEAFIQRFFAESLPAQIHLDSAIDAFTLLTNEESADFSRELDVIRSQLDDTFADDYDLDQQERNLQVRKLKQWLQHMARLTSPLFKLKAWRGQEDVSDVLLINHKPEYQVERVLKLEPTRDPIETLIKSYLQVTDAYELLRQLIVAHAEVEVINHPALQSALDLYFSSQQEKEVSMLAESEVFPDENSQLNRIKALNAALAALKMVVDGRAYHIHVDASFIRWGTDGYTLDIDAFYIEKDDGLKYLYTFDTEKNQYVVGQWQTSSALTHGMRLTVSESQGSVKTANLPRNMVLLAVDRPQWNTAEGINSSAIAAEKEEMLCLELNENLNRNRKAKPDFAHEHIYNQLLEMLKQPNKVNERVLLLQLLFALQQGESQLEGQTDDLHRFEKQFPSLPSRFRTFDGYEVDAKFESFRFMLSTLFLSFFTGSLLYKPNIDDDFLPGFTSQGLYDYLLNDTYPLFNAFFYCMLGMGVASGLVALTRFISDGFALYNHFFAGETTDAANFSSHMKKKLGAAHPLGEVYTRFADMSEVNKPHDPFWSNLSNILAKPFSTVRLIGQREFWLRKILDYSNYAVIAYAGWLINKARAAAENVYRPAIADASSPYLQAIATKGVLYNDDTDSGLTLYQSLFLLSGLMAFNVQWFFLIPDLLLQAKRGISSSCSAAAGFFKRINIFDTCCAKKDEEQKGLIQKA